ncbi:MAG TPA: ubiquinol-cytochrome C chaperone family protein [Rhizomicrobium sp.]|nr:ubiquinol-cytochrome C chaperone family protein [Rhizomicrobium sp.]
MLNALRRRSETDSLVRQLQAALNVRAREPVFFREFGAEDTIDGRFDILALHAWLVLSRLEVQGRNDLARRLADSLFIGFDEALRDLGAGDMGMGRRIKKFADAFNGRMVAYEGAKDPAALADAMIRNIYRGRPGHEAQARALTAYALSAQAHLARQDLTQGTVDFGALPELT